MPLNTAQRYLKINGKFVPTVAVTDGDPGEVNTNALLEGTEGLYASMHSHGNVNDGSSDTFSAQDAAVGVAQKIQYGIETTYVVVPAGAVHRYTPNSRRDIPLKRNQFKMNTGFVTPSNASLHDYSKRR